MNKLYKIIFFICIFSYIFSQTKITNIESSNVILGEKATFNLTVQNYYGFLVHRFYLGDNAIKDQITLKCKEISDTFLTCEADLNINKLEYLKNEKQKLIGVFAFVFIITYLLNVIGLGAFSFITIIIAILMEFVVFILELIIMNFIIQVFLLNLAKFQSQIVKKMKLIII